MYFCTLPIFIPPSFSQLEISEVHNPSTTTIHHSVNTTIKTIYSPSDTNNTKTARRYTMLSSIIKLQILNIILHPLIHLPFPAFSAPRLSFTMVLLIDKVGKVFLSLTRNFSADVNIYTPDGVIHIESTGRIGFTPLHPRVSPGFASMLRHQRSMVGKESRVNMLVGWDDSADARARDHFISPRTCWIDILYEATYNFRRRVLDRGDGTDTSLHPAIAYQIRYWYERTIPQFLRRVDPTKLRQSRIPYRPIPCHRQRRRRRYPAPALTNWDPLLHLNLPTQTDEALGCAVCGVPLLPTVSCRHVSVLPPDGFPL